MAVVASRAWGLGRGVSAGAADRLGRGALRALVATSPATAWLLITAGLAGSWLATHVPGGADTVVPHWYYLPIVFAAARFGPLAALLVALVSGLLAGPLTLVNVADSTAQETARWLSRTAFFVVIGQFMAGLVSPALPNAIDELRRRRHVRAVGHGLANGEFYCVYQPIVDLATAQPVGVEALVRWRHPRLGELAPGAFLPAAEHTDVMHELGGFVLDTACRQAAAWNALCGQHGWPRLQLNVNLSGRELEAPDLIDRVRPSLETNHLRPAQLCLEITESVLIDDVDACVRQLTALQSLGVQLAVDDFGTGYSSLSAVHRFPLDVLKVDRSFIEALGNGGQSEAICGGIVLFARTVGLTTVAEGIETPAQHQAAVDCGYDHAQGYHYDRPMSGHDVTHLLRHQPPSSSTSNDVNTAKAGAGQPAVLPSP